MKILEVLIQRFLSYGKGTEVSFDDGLTALVGPNGSGKTGLGLEATCWALWGKTTRGTVPDGEVTVRFETGGRAWEVSRLRKGRRAGALNLRRMSGIVVAGAEGAEDMTGQTSGETQSKVEALVGSWDRFCAERVFSNRLRARFGSSTDKERKALIESVLGLERHERAAELARAELGKRRNDLQAARQDVAAAGAVLSRARESASGFGVPVAVLADAEREAARAAADVESLEKAIPLLRAQVEERRGKLGVLKKAYDQVVQQGRADQAAADREEAAGAAALARAAAGAAMGDCPTCLTPASQVPRERLRAHHEAEAAAAGAQGAALLDRVQGARAEALELRDDVVRAQGALTEAEGHERAADERRGAAGRQNVRAAQELEWARSRAERAEAARLAVLDADAEAGRFQEVEAARELACLEGEAVAKVLGSRGARVRRMDGALARLTAEANQVLSRLGMGMRVRVSGTRTLAGGKEVDEVSVAVEGAGGGEYDGASDGERARLDVAIMLGMSRVAGTGEGLLVFDEILDPLDDEGLERVVELLEEISRTRQVILTTHNPRFLAMLPASRLWRVSRGPDGLSRVEAA